MIAKFFFQTKKRNQLLKTVMNGALCFIGNSGVRCNLKEIYFALP